MHRRLIFPVIAMGVVVVISNILVQRVFTPWPFLTYGAFTFPFAFLVVDTTNRILGAQDARHVVLWGVGVGLLCSGAAALLGTESEPLITRRIALGSVVAFLVAQLINVQLFAFIRKVLPYRNDWWQAPVVSSTVSSIVDTCIFFTIAFGTQITWLGSLDDVAWANEILPLLDVGPQVPLWISFLCADLLVKLLAIVLLLPIYRLIVSSIRH